MAGLYAPHRKDVTSGGQLSATEAILRFAERKGWTTLLQLDGTSILEKRFEWYISLTSMDISVHLVTLGNR